MKIVHHTESDRPRLKWTNNNFIKGKNPQLVSKNLRRFHITMASNANYYLCLKEFEDNAKMYWQELQMEKQFCDMTLSCDEIQIKTHKLIISFCSSVLRNILKLNQTQHPVMYLRKVT